MITREELLKSSEYWIETIQNKVFSDVSDYIEKNDVSNKSIAERLGLSKGRVSQILSGENLNFRLETLVKLCLAIERIPDFHLIDIKDFISREKISADSTVFNPDKNKVTFNELQNYSPVNSSEIIKMNLFEATGQSEADYESRFDNKLKVA